MSRSLRRTRVAVALAAVAIAVLAMPACTGGDRAPAAPPPPATEFLLAAGDSTFWVASDSAGVRLRGAPMTLARWGPRFYEIYVADDDRSYYDAVFVGQRIFRRDLVSGDSLGVFEDTLIAAQADEYAAAHPAESPLGPNEDGSENPRVSATSDVVLLDVLGPWLAYEYRADIDGRRELHTAHRGTVDLRTGARATLETMFGKRIADSVAAAGRLAFAATLDSIRSARDDRASRVAGALAGLAFDARSFALVADGRQPAIAFLVPGHGAAAGLSLPLAPVHVPAPPWWPELARTLPDSSDRDTDRWAGTGLAVVARYDSSDLAGVALQRGAEAWPVGRLPAPVRQLWWLDRPPLDRESRQALIRAFDESALYSDETRVARAAAPQGVPAVHPVRATVASCARGVMFRACPGARPSRSRSTRRPRS